jgi:FMN phosphatase YigB (HAD superfamily)
MKTYSTLIFDAFDTVIHIERERLPEHSIGESIGHTTAPKVYEVYTKEDEELPFEDFVNAFLESSAEAYRRRNTDFKEIPSADRFRIMLEILGKDAHNFTPDFPERLAETHMEHFGPALDILPESHQLLEWALHAGYRLAMISNFDYSPTLYQCLERHALRNIFEVIVVSDGLGWRKPHPHIFEVTLKKLGIAPGDALFIGDRLDIDVDGAAGVGLDSVWIDTGLQKWTPQHAQPRHTIGSLGELRTILEANHL